MSLDMKKLMQQAMEIQQKMVQAQQDLEAMQVVGEAAGSGVQVTVSGNGDVVAVKIPRDAIDPDDPAMLEDLVLMAMRDALQKAKALMQEHLQQSTGMPQPPFF